MMIDNIQPDHVNIVEGGSAYYLFYFKNKLRPGELWKNTIDKDLIEFYREYDIKSLVLYFDTSTELNRICERSRSMILSGAIDEVIAFRTRLKSIQVQKPLLLPIGYQEISCLIDNYHSDLAIKAKTKLIHGCYNGLNIKTRKYSKTQFKYLRKFFVDSGSYWIDTKSNDFDMDRILDIAEHEDKLIPDFGQFLRSNEDRNYVNIERELASKLDCEDIKVVINKLDGLLG